MKVKAFKSPRIVMPTQLMIEEDCDSDTGNDRANDQTSLMDEYLTLDIPMVSYQNKSDLDIIQTDSMLTGAA